MEVVAEVADLDSAPPLRARSPSRRAGPGPEPARGPLVFLRFPRSGLEHPNTQIVVLTMQSEPAYARLSAGCGRAGYVLKEAAESELVEAVRRAADGSLISPSLGARVPEPPPGPPDGLSEREVEVLRMIALGHTNAEIAEQLYLSVRTVETHRAHIKQKLGLKCTLGTGALRARPRTHRKQLARLRGRSGMRSKIRSLLSRPSTPVVAWYSGEAPFSSFRGVESVERATEVAPARVGVSQAAAPARELRSALDDPPGHRQSPGGHAGAPRPGWRVGPWPGRDRGAVRRSWRVATTAVDQRPRRRHGAGDGYPGLRWRRWPSLGERWGSARRYSGAPSVISSPRKTGLKGFGSTGAPRPAAIVSATASACWAASPPCLRGNAGGVARRVHVVDADDLSEVSRPG